MNYFSFKPLFLLFRSETKNIEPKNTSRFKIKIFFVANFFLNEK